MKIFWHGKTCFEIESNGKTREPISIIIDPIDKNYPTKDNHILLLTHPCEYNKKEKAFTISAPGEYEVREVFIQGIPAKEQKVIYLIKLNEFKICHLGTILESELSESALKEIGDVDILMLPASEDDKTKIVNQIEPAVVIPMDYDNLDLFLKRMGEKQIDPIDYYKGVKKNIEESEKTDIVILNKK